MEWMNEANLALLLVGGNARIALVFGYDFIWKIPQKNRF